MKLIKKIIIIIRIIDLINFLRIFFVFKKGNWKLEYMKRTTFSINMVIGNEKQKLGKQTHNFSEYVEKDCFERVV